MTLVGWTSSSRVEVAVEGADEENDSSLRVGDGAPPCEWK